MTESLTFLYLVQSDSILPKIYHCLRSKEYILLSYKENTVDTHIFYPGSTWTTGRNKLREYALSLEKKYDYYIFIDNDIMFNNYTNEFGFNTFELLINKYKPPIANPNYVGYYNVTTFPYLPQPLQEAQTTIWFDGICNAISYDTLININIYPLIDKFDHKSWWMSQYGFFQLCSLFNIQVSVFPHLLISNNSHSNYPRGMLENEFNAYLYQNLAQLNGLTLINNSEGNGIFKITNFFNKYLNCFNTINIIDVGCAIGDFNRLLNHPNKNIIGIDPLIDKYLKRDYNIIHTYNKIFTNAIDIDESDKIFNVTTSLDTSSLQEFDSITTDIDISNTGNHFYIPNNILEFMTNIDEKIIVKTKTLNSVIKESNLTNSIIHILKVDAQGNDLNVIKSGYLYIKNVLFIVIESVYDTSGLLYKNSTKFSEDYNYMKSLGFEILIQETLLKDDCDCLYYNTNLIRDFDFNWDKKEFYVLEPKI